MSAAEHILAARHPEARYVTWAVAGSTVVHAGLLGLFIVMTLLEPPKLDLAQKPVSAKLVRLGEKRADTLLPRISSPAAPQPSAMPSPMAIKPRDPATPSKPSNNTPAKDAAKARHDLFSAFSNAARPAPKDEPQVGSPDGDPGGDSDSADEGERYFGLILARARRNYGVTKTIPPQELIRLKATVVIFINSTGELIKDPEVQVSSGNEQFDQDVILSLRKAAPFGPPPPHLANTLKTVGIAFEATP